MRSRLSWTYRMRVMKITWQGPLERLDEYMWRIPRSYRPDMKRDAIIFTDEQGSEQVRVDEAPEQLANVACLPGLVGDVLAMPDMHWGYGFPIGGVAATSMKEGVISPGGVGYDINCGVRLLRADVPADEAEGKMAQIMDVLFEEIPAGVGSERQRGFGLQDLRRALTEGARWVVEAGFGEEADLRHTEEEGCVRGASAEAMSKRAMKRGLPQLGTLGGGNHFIEVGRVEEVFDRAVARAFGLEVDTLTIILHTGSRGLGHQVCSEYIDTTLKASRKYGIDLPDPQLACAPLRSSEGEAYLAAMNAAANYAWANRQILTHLVRKSLERVLGDVRVETVYDQAHNIAKIEEHLIGGRRRKVCVHRKGATRAFGPGRPEVPASYRSVGQPVLVPGDMASGSFVLVGTAKAMELSYGSACHGAGRSVSRGAAKRSIRGSAIRQELAERGIVVRASRDVTLAEEAPAAYKSLDMVVEVIHGSGLATKVARITPMGVMKG